MAKCRKHKPQMMVETCPQCLLALVNQNEQQAKRIKELEKIADLAYDIHTRDPVNVKRKWGVCGASAEKMLCEMIEALKGGE